MSVSCQPVFAQQPSNQFDYARTKAFTYNANGTMATQTVEQAVASDCLVQSYGYDATGNKTLTTTASCAGATGAAAFASRSDSLNYAAVAAQSITVNGTTTSVSVPAGLLPSTSQNALSQPTGYQFDPRFGLNLSSTDPNGLQVSATLDDFGRRTRVTQPDGTSIVFFYCILSSSGLSTASNSSGCPTPASGEAPSDAMSFKHWEEHNISDIKMGAYHRDYSDRLGRIIRTVDESFDAATQPANVSGVAIVSDTVFSPYGPVSLQSRPYFLATGSPSTSGSNDVGATMFVNDDLARIVTQYDADPSSASSVTFGGTSGVSFGSYGSQRAAASVTAYSGTTVTRTNAHGQAAIRETDLLGNVNRITDASGAQLARLFGAFGELVKTTDPLQNTTTYQYDYVGRVLSIQDPDRGLMTAAYDPLGNQVSKQTAVERVNSQTTSFSYDVLNRLVARSEPEGTTTWFFDSYSGGTTCLAGIGRLCEVTTTTGLDRKIVYDAKGRPSNELRTISGGVNMARSEAYDSVTGRLTSIIYPTGLQVGYSYTSRGYPQSVTLLTASTVAPLPAVPGGSVVAGASLPSGTTLWSAQIENAAGKLEAQVFQNGITGKKSFEAATGRLLGVLAGAGSATTVLNQSYSYDTLSNLVARSDQNGDGSGAVTESFSYGDASNNALNINRLTQYTVAGPSIPGLSRSVTLQYNATGSILGKDDVGNLSYPASGAGSVGPHAIASYVGGGVTTTLGHDANGNVISASGGSYVGVSYTSFNKPDGQSGASGPSGTPHYLWAYDENRARVKETRTISGQGANAGTRTTWYFNLGAANDLFFESETDAPITPSAQYPAGTQNRHFISSHDGESLGTLITTGALPTLVAGQTAPTALASTTLVKVEFWHSDLIGSVVTTTDHLGDITERYSYDPFGKRRVPGGAYDSTGAAGVDWNIATNAGTDRGYTGFEHLDDIGLVNTNGRLYDPKLGTFIQADPLVSDAHDIQSYNRYGYVVNNPFSGTDPTGFDGPSGSDEGGADDSGSGGWQGFMATVGSIFKNNSSVQPSGNTSSASSPLADPGSSSSESSQTAGRGTNTTGMTPSYSYCSDGHCFNVFASGSGPTPAGAPEEGRILLEFKPGPIAAEKPPPESPSDYAAEKLSELGQSFKNAAKYGRFENDKNYRRWADGLNDALKEGGARGMDRYIGQNGGIGGWMKDGVAAATTGGSSVLGRAAVGQAEERAALGLVGFTKAPIYGIRSYSSLRAVTKGSGLQVHHLIEKRFASVFGVKEGDMMSIVLTPAEHQVFTNAWQAAIPRGLGTANATKEQVLNAARQIYKDYPAILNALGL